MPKEEVLLRVEDLKTYFHTYEGVVKALEGIDVDVRRGETMGLVGETGCGKSVSALTIMGLIPIPPGKVESGHILLGEPSRARSLRNEYDEKFKGSPKDREKEIESLRKKLDSFKEGQQSEDAKNLEERLAALTNAYDLLAKSPEELNEIRGDRISMIFQEPMTALNPAYTIGDQIGETIELHQMDKLVDDVVKQLDLETKASSQGLRAGKKVQIIDTGTGKPAENLKSMRTAKREVCSRCGTFVRDDWGACTGCGARFSSGVVSAPVRRVFQRIALSYYTRLKENRYNTWAYLVRSNPISVRLERRLSLAKLIRAEEALRDVKIAEPSRIVKSYPFELSGGMRQRAMIAMMMACKPDLLIADEPTTALDVTVEAQILSLMKEMQRARDMSILLITHDLGVIAETCHRVAVMYAGYIVELSTTEEIFALPMHPYTNALLKSIPKIGPKYINDRKKPLYVIPGVVPNLLKPPPGCRFHPRCERAMDKCSNEVPSLVELAPGHFVSCHNPVPMTKGGSP